MTIRYYILDKHRRPVRVPKQEDFDKWFSYERNRRVARTEVPGGIISTVFIGLAPVGIDDPKLFETMVFGTNRDREKCYYHTWQEAYAGHEKIVKELTL